MPFIVINDTASALTIEHRFIRANAPCHASDYRGAKGNLRVGENVAFRCAPEEIAFIQFMQGGRSCRMDTRDLIASGREVKASMCFAEARLTSVR